MADLDLPVLDLLHEASGFQVRDHPVSGIQPILAGIGARVRIQGSVVVQYVDDADLVAVALPHFVVIGVVGRCDLNTARTEFRFSPLIQDERHLPIKEREHDLTPLFSHFFKFEELGEEVGLALFDTDDLLLQERHFFFGRGPELLFKQPVLAVQLACWIGVAGHGGIPQHGLGPGGGHDRVLGFSRLWVDNRIAHVPEVALDRLVYDLVV